MGAGSKNKSISIDSHVKISNFGAEINIFTMVLVSIAEFHMHDNSTLDVISVVTLGMGMIGQI